MTTQRLSRLDIESLPNYKKKTSREWSSTCPICGGQDRFLFWPADGNYYCRQCELSGFVLEVDQKYLTAEQREAWARATAERKRKEADDRLSAIERLQQMVGKVKWYHSQVSQALDYWYSQGLTDSTICQYQLGYCPQCPTDPDSPSFTIPYFCAARLIHLRHRLKYPNGHGKYRPEFAGLGNQLFNADTLAIKDDISFGFLESGEVLIVEGEIKTMVLEQVGFKTVGIPGANSWRDDWASELKGIERAFVCLDPGADIQAARIASSLKSQHIESKIVVCPVKPDDLFIRYAGTPGDLLELIHQGRMG